MQGWAAHGRGHSSSHSHGSLFSKGDASVRFLEAVSTQSSSFTAWCLSLHTCARSSTKLLSKTQDLSSLIEMGTWD